MRELYLVDKRNNRIGQYSTGLSTSIKGRGRSFHVMTCRHFTRWINNAQIDTVFAVNEATYRLHAESQAKTQKWRNMDGYAEPYIVKVDGAEWEWMQ